MKPDKSDGIYDVVSDMYKNGPDELYSHLATMLRGFFSHGHIPKSLLLCTLRPLVKNNLDDITQSSNYRAIAGGCLILKLVDQIFLLLEETKLTFDEHQYAYQKNSSPTMCTWMVLSVVEHFNQKGTPIFGASMDMSKAYDMVSWVQIF